MIHLFQILLYQPFLNLLLGLYWLLNILPNANIDMGVAVIIFSVIIRVLLLPVSLAAHRSEKERRDIADKIIELEQKYKDNPVGLREESKKVLRGNRRILIAELISLGIQVSISLILWAIFASGLNGKDAPLMYSFMPKVFPIPASKLFFMSMNLTEPHWQLNVFQSFLIFVLETLGTYISPYPVQKSDVVRYQLFLPLLSFAIFAFLPAGKKLFVITTLIFSIVLTLFLAIRKKFYDISERLKRQDEAAAHPREDSVVVDVK
ncbi:MAG: YidC/Oxa1 family membrane protein insertase [Patescibacteria group bacterium]